MTRLVAVHNIVKKFTGTVALKDVSLDIHAGEVHVLLGENGAGKSTLMKILSGIYAPTSGDIILGSESFKALTPTQSRSYGIRLIYQELSVIDYLSIEENLFVGSLPTRKVLGISVIDRHTIREKARKAMARVGLHRHPTTLVGSLSISEKQQVEIAKALVDETRVIIMDEPTSSLTEEEVAHLFKVINELRAAGLGIVYISHKLKEIPIIGDKVSVLKDGGYVGTFDAKTTSTDQLVTYMVGRELTHERLLGQAIDHHQTVLDVSELSSRDGRVDNVSFTLQRGEILGFAGLMGSGRSELMETIFGARARSKGSITLNNVPINATTPTAAIRAGIAMVTEDRRRSGFFHNFTIAQNISILPWVKSSRYSLSLAKLDFAYEAKVGQQYRERLNIRCASAEQNITELSGGNQQKAIIAKWLAAKSDLFIFDEPTRGIDIGAKAEIYQILRELADAGRGIIVVSSELPELLAICDRIAVYRHGNIAKIFNNADATEENIMHEATA